MCVSAFSNVWEGPAYRHCVLCHWSTIKVCEVEVVLVFRLYYVFCLFDNNSGWTLLTDIAGFFGSCRNVMLYVAVISSHPFREFFMEVYLYLRMFHIVFVTMAWCVSLHHRCGRADKAESLFQDLLSCCGLVDKPASITEHPVTTAVESSAAEYVHSMHSLSSLLVPLHGNSDALLQGPCRNYCLTVC